MDECSISVLNLCYRDYRVEYTSSHGATHFSQWLRSRCATLTEAERLDCPELMAISVPPSKKVCEFRGMTSFGSHYRVDVEEEGPRHVTFDSGVAELQCRRGGRSELANPMQVELVRVGVLKNILVLSYGNLNIVLMVLSWVAKHTEERPTIVRDAHGFWLANMAGRPRDTTSPYLLPALASQVEFMSFPAHSLYMVHVGILYANPRPSPWSWHHAGFFCAGQGNARVVCGSQKRD